MFFNFRNFLSQLVFIIVVWHLCSLNVSLQKDFFSPLCLFPTIPEGSRLICNHLARCVSWRGVATTQLLLSGPDWTLVKRVNSWEEKVNELWFRQKLCTWGSVFSSCSATPSTSESVHFKTHKNHVGRKKMQRGWAAGLNTQRTDLTGRHDTVPLITEEGVRLQTRCRASQQNKNARH